MLQFLPILHLFTIQWTHAHNYSSLWCHGSHVDSRQCTFRNLCYSHQFDEFIFLRDPIHSLYSGIIDPEETKELLKIPPHQDYLYLSTFKASDHSKLLLSSHNPYEVLLIHVKHLEPLLQGSLDRFFNDVLLPILKTLNPLCYGDLIHCSFPRILLKYEEGAPRLENEYQTLLKKMFKTDFIFEIFPFTSSEISCFEKVHIGNLDEKYSGTSFRELILENLQLGGTTYPHSPFALLLANNSSRQGLSQDIMNVMKELCQDCALEVESFDLSNIKHLLNAIISAKVIISYENFLTAGLLMPSESILLQPLSQGVEESSKLLNILRNRDKVKYRTWIPEESLPLADFQMDEEELEDERLWIYPSRVQAFECYLEIKSSELFVNLIWDPPLNAQYFHSLTYELLVQGMKLEEGAASEDLDFLDQFSIKERQISLTVNVKMYSALKVYILAKSPLEDGFENKGIDAHFICDLDKDIKFS